MLVPRETVRYIIQQYKATKCIGNLFGRGSKRKTSAATDRMILRKIKSNRRIPAHVVKAEIEVELGMTLNANTTRNRAHEAGLFGRVARKKPLVNKVNSGKRLKFARDMLKKPIEFWETVILSDKSKFNLFDSHGKVMVWRTPKEEYDPHCIMPTVKHGGGSVTVWSCFAGNGVGKTWILHRNMDRFYYRDILGKYLLPSIKKFNLGPDFFFMHDNDPKHTSVLIKDWLKEQKISTLSWPLSSSDLNPIEHLWDELERRVKKHQLKNIQQLQVLLKDEWNQIEPTVF